MNNRRIKKKTAFTAGILLAALYAAIFGFSEQDGETSGGISMSLSRYGVDLWNRLHGGRLSEFMRMELAEYFEHPLRKMAHFAEYAVMGILVCCFLYAFTEAMTRIYCCALLWVFISAALDELHQYFVPGRWASFWDVLLDTCGGAVGGALCLLALQKIRKNSLPRNLPASEG